MGGQLKSLRHGEEGCRARNPEGLRKVAQREEQLEAKGQTAAEPLVKSKAMALGSPLLENIYWGNS